MGNLLVSSSLLRILFYMQKEQIVAVGLKPINPEHPRSFLIQTIKDKNKPIQI